MIMLIPRIGTRTVISKLMNQSWYKRMCGTKLKWLPRRWCLLLIHFSHHNFQFQVRRRGQNCDLCDSGPFLDLARHKRQQHDSAVFACGEPCQYKTLRESDLRRHQQGADCIVSNPGFPCQFCGVIKKSPEAVARHLRRNQCIQQFKCVFCDQTFSLKSMCKSHQKKDHPDDSL